ncbi:MAG: glycosyltransferase [Deltaproteobacteria bacterium]|nr:glycosyltransferase [Deltaproteobacteria bacterium]MBN2670385.1 glycosyltransferase [Deltaproteobacteria bacterium]
MNDNRLRAALGYTRFQSVPKILLFDTSYLMVQDVADAAEDLGWTVVRLPTPKQGRGDGQFVASLLQVLVLHRPDFILTVNHLGFDSGGVLSGLLAQYGIPVASWFVDHPMPILGGADSNATDNAQLFCFERTAISWLEKRGYESPVFLPSASNARYFSPHLTEARLVDKYRCEISLAANSWWYKARVEPSKQIRRKARMLMSQHSNSDGALADVLAESLQNDDRAVFGAAQVALAEASLVRRQRFIQALSSLNVTLYGDDYWKHLVPGVAIHPYLDYHSELPALFKGSDVNMNITSAQMPTAVNQRVWDVPAVGGFLLTDAQDDALEAFEAEVSMAFYRSFEEAASKAEYYLRHPDERVRISQKGMEIVHRSHRMTHRLQTMYAVMKKRFG